MKGKAQLQNIAYNLQSDFNFTSDQLDKFSSNHTLLLLNRMSKLFSTKF